MFTQVFVRLPPAGNGPGEMLVIDINATSDSVAQVYRAVANSLGGNIDEFWLEDRKGNYIQNKKKASFSSHVLDSNELTTPFIVGYDHITIVLETIVGMYNIEIGCWDDVSALKIVVSRATGISGEDQQLFLLQAQDKLKELNHPFRWLGSLGIESGSVIKMVVTPDLPKIAKLLPMHPVLASLQAHSVCPRSDCEWILSNSDHDSKEFITLRCRKCEHRLSLVKIEKTLSTFGLASFCNWIQTYNSHRQYGPAALDMLLGGYVLTVEYATLNNHKEAHSGETSMPAYSELMRFAPPPRKGAAGGLATSPETAQLTRAWRDQCRAVRQDQSRLELDNTNHSRPKDSSDLVVTSCEVRQLDETAELGAKTAIKRATEAAVAAANALSRLKQDRTDLTRALEEDNVLKTNIVGSQIEAVDGIEVDEKDVLKMKLPNNVQCCREALRVREKLAAITTPLPKSSNQIARNTKLADQWERLIKGGQVLRERERKLVATEEHQSGGELRQYDKTLERRAKMKVVAEATEKLVSSMDEYSGASEARKFYQHSLFLAPPRILLEEKESLSENEVKGDQRYHSDREDDGRDMEVVEEEEEEEEEVLLKKEREDFDNDNLQSLYQLVSEVQSSIPHDLAEPVDRGSEGSVDGDWRVITDQVQEDISLVKSEILGLLEEKSILLSAVDTSKLSPQEKRRIPEIAISSFPEPPQVSAATTTSTTTVDIKLSLQRRSLEAKNRIEAVIRKDIADQRQRKEKEAELAAEKEFRASRLALLEEQVEEATHDSFKLVALDSDDKNGHSMRPRSKLEEIREHIKRSREAFELQQAEKVKLFEHHKQMHRQLEDEILEQEVFGPLEEETEAVTLNNIVPREVAEALPSADLRNPSPICPDVVTAYDPSLHMEMEGDNFSKFEGLQTECDSVISVDDALSFAYESKGSSVNSEPELREIHENIPEHTNINCDDREQDSRKLAFSDLNDEEVISLINESLTEIGHDILDFTVQEVFNKVEYDAGVDMRKWESEIEHCAKRFAIQALEARHIHTQGRALSFSCSENGNEEGSMDNEERAERAQSLSYSENGNEEASMDNEEQVRALELALNNSHSREVKLGQSSSLLQQATKSDHKSFDSLQSSVAEVSQLKSDVIRLQEELIATRSEVVEVENRYKQSAQSDQVQSSLQREVEQLKHELHQSLSKLNDTEDRNNQIDLDLRLHDELNRLHHELQGVQQQLTLKTQDEKHFKDSITRHAMKELDTTVKQHAMAMERLMETRVQELMRVGKVAAHQDLAQLKANREYDPTNEMVRGARRPGISPLGSDELEMEFDTITNVPLGLPTNSKDGVRQNWLATERSLNTEKVVVNNPAREQTQLKEMERVAVVAEEQEAEQFELRLEDSKGDTISQQDASYESAIEDSVKVLQPTTVIPQEETKMRPKAPIVTGSKESTTLPVEIPAGSAKKTRQRSPRVTALKEQKVTPIVTVEEIQAAMARCLQSSVYMNATVFFRSLAKGRDKFLTPAQFAHGVMRHTGLRLTENDNSIKQLMNQLGCDKQRRITLKDLKRNWYLLDGSAEKFSAKKFKANEVDMQVSKKTSDPSSVAVKFKASREKQKKKPFQPVLSAQKPPATNGTPREDLKATAVKKAAPREDLDTINHKALKEFTFSNEQRLQQIDDMQALVHVDSLTETRSSAQSDLLYAQSNDHEVQKELDVDKVWANLTMTKTSTNSAEVLNIEDVWDSLRKAKDPAYVPEPSASLEEEAYRRAKAKKLVPRPESNTIIDQQHGSSGDEEDEILNEISDQTELLIEATDPSQQKDPSRDVDRNSVEEVKSDVSELDVEDLENFQSDLFCLLREFELERKFSKAKQALGGRTYQHIIQNGENSFNSIGISNLLSRKMIARAHLLTDARKDKHLSKARLSFRELDRVETGQPQEENDELLDVETPDDEEEVEETVCKHRFTTNDDVQAFYGENENWYDAVVLACRENEETGEQEYDIEFVGFGEDAVEYNKPADEVASIQEYTDEEEEVEPENGGEEEHVQKLTETLFSEGKYSLTKEETFEEDFSKSDLAQLLCELNLDDADLCDQIAVNCGSSIRTLYESGEEALFSLGVMKGQTVKKLWAKIVEKWQFLSFEGSEEDDEEEDSVSVCKHRFATNDDVQAFYGEDENWYDAVVLACRENEETGEQEYDIEFVGFGEDAVEYNKPADEVASIQEYTDDEEEVEEETPTQ